MCAGLVAFAVSARADTAWRAKVEPRLLGETTAGEPVEFIAILGEQAPLDAARQLPGRAARGRFVVQRLRETADRSQADLLAWLNRQDAEFKPFWIVNAVWVRGTSALLAAVAARADVEHVYANPRVFTDPETPSGPEPSPRRASGIEWNISKVQADLVWALGYAGQGVTVGGADTGYQWNHPALIRQYRGWDGTNANHNYNWHDAIHTNQGASTHPCGYNAAEPCDDYGHGTHTMGIMVGDDGAGNQIGVAPQARWIGCRCMDNGWGTPASYIECLQWFIAPTDLNDQNPDPSLAPAVINNSWSCPSSEGCVDVNVLSSAVHSVRAAGILIVSSAGNNGGSCETVNEPIAIYDDTFSVGNTTSSDGIYGSSSRGPVTVDGSGRMKPDVCAPGVSIRSAYHNGGYGNMTGTSMAAPHAAGLVALILSARGALFGDVDALEQLICAHAVPLTTAAQACGGVPGTNVPNNTFGYGRIDALATVTNARTFTNVYAIVATGGPGGWVSPAGRSLVASGDTVQVAVRASNYFHIAALLTNGTTAAITNDAALDVSWTNAQDDGTVTATFAENLAAYGTPERWLAERGWTNDFDAAAANDADGDHVATWEEYYAGTDPTNGASFFQCLEISDPNFPILGKVVRWNAVSGRLYAIEAATNSPAGGWLELTNGLAAPVNSWTDTAPSAANAQYRVKAGTP